MKLFVYLVVGCWCVIMDCVNYKMFRLTFSVTMHTRGERCSAIVKRCLILTLQHDDDNYVHIKKLCHYHRLSVSEYNIYVGRFVPARLCCQYLVLQMN